jgi:hypothetical protein
MSNEYADPSGNTEQFKAFVQAPPDQSTRSRMPLIVGGAVFALLVVLVVALLLG